MDAAYSLKRYEEAAEWARRGPQQPNSQCSRYTVLIAALAQLGRLDEARNCIQQLQVKRPSTSIAFVREAHLFGDTASFAHYLDGLRMAGLSDRGYRYHLSPPAVPCFRSSRASWETLGEPLVDRSRCARCRRAPSRIQDCAMAPTASAQHRGPVDNTAWDCSAIWLRFLAACRTKVCD